MTIRRHLSSLPPRIKCYISQSTDPYTNLAFEDWILRTSHPLSHVLYLWRNRPTIVIGRNQNPWKECNLDLMARRDVLLARRSSGGGSVYHDLGNSNYTVVLPREEFARDMCASMVARALQLADVPGAHVTGRHDVAVDGLKVSGSAFKLTKHRAFHHGTMLIDADLDRLHGCLRSRARDRIDAKGVDSVPSPVANLRDYSLSMDHSLFCDVVMREFSNTFSTELTADNVHVFDTVEPSIRQEAERIRSWDWLYGQTPEFVNKFSRRFNGWHSTVFVSIKSRRGMITAMEVGTSPSALQPPEGVRGLFCEVSKLLVGVRYESADIVQTLAPLYLKDSRAKELCDWIIDMM